MLKIWKYAYFYTIVALVGGVFFREFTKIQGFQGVTTLSVVHTHALVLGLVFLLLLLMLEKSFRVSSHPRYALFFKLYNAGLCITIIMLLVRGIVQVLATPLSTSMDAMISGIAGIGHIALGISLLLFLTILKARITAIDKNS